MPHIGILPNFLSLPKVARLRIFLALVFAATLATCNSLSSPPKASSHTVADLEFTSSEVSPWKQYFLLLIPDSLIYNALDGGAVQYIDNGLVETTEQRLWKPDSAGDSLMCRVLIMDFGTPSKAAAMFGTMVAAIPVEKTFSSFPASVAAVNDAPLVGNTTYAHFDRFYFQFDLVNYFDKTKALSDAEVFVKTMQSKVSQ